MLRGALAKLSNPTLRRSALAALAATAVLLSAAAIINTYAVFSGTFDEPDHVACGMEYLDRGRYTYEPMHPPLARVAVAMGPYLAGLRSTGESSLWREGRNILYARGTYVRNLSLARLGVLPFYLLLAAVVWRWARRVAGDVAGALATGILATLPPVLAHAGLATTDLALTATLTAALFAFTLWLDQRTLPRSLALGVACAAATTAKLSALVFLPAGMGAILAVHLLGRKSQGVPAGPVPGRPVHQSLAVAVATGALVLWAVYRFSLAPVAGGPPVPAPEFWRGITQLVELNRHGHESFLLGQVSAHGWWYFFPVALAVKSPIPFLVLVMTGGAAALRVRDRSAFAVLGPGAGAAAIVLIAMSFNLSMGLRHVLPVYPLGTIVASYGAIRLWHTLHAPAVARGATVLLLAWQLVSTVRAHPDYLPWFNQLAGERPDRILVDSDLDWGQDLLRLADTVRARHIDSLALAYFGSADPRFHLSRVRPMAPFERPAGWFAVSVAVTKGMGARGFEWLDSIPPVATVGKSIRLYRLAPPAGN